MRLSFKKIQHIFELVKFSHSIFALPFALSSLLLATHGRPSWKLVGFIILAMVFARNTAMAFNRLVDAKLDAKNPRTTSRHLPKKILSHQFVLIFIIINAILFIGTTYFFNQLTFALSPLVLLMICFYSLTKRWTHYTHIFLGITLGISPIAAWIAATGSLDLVPLLLGGAVLFWVAGFDLIYATQDYEHDKNNQIKSMVVLLGIPRALVLSRLFHCLSLIFLVSIGLTPQRGPFGVGPIGLIYFGTLTFIALAFIYEHSLVKPNDLSKVNAAFFNVNGVIGLVYFLGVLGEMRF